MLPGPRDIWLWIVTIFDDIFVEKFWYRLRHNDPRGAGRAVGELIIGFPGCWLGVAILAALVILLVRAL